MQNNKRINNNLKTLLIDLKKQGVLDWAKKLQKEFSKAEIYLVGGAVRDSILPAFAPKKSYWTTAGKDKNKIKDLDFVVRNISFKNLHFFLNKLGWVEELGKNFGVLKFKPEKKIKDPNFEPLDIALPRSEMSTSQGGYKDFKIKFNKDLNIKKDLLRRDFTINAVALRLPAFATNAPTGLWRTGSCVLKHKKNCGKFQIIDPFDGVSDINKKIIKCVGKPEERLQEDYTRILRAVRFACQLDFKIENKTKIALKKLAPRLNDFLQTREVKVRGGFKKITDFVAPREVVAKEILKAFSENHLKAIKLYDQLGLFKILMPEILKMKKCEQPKNFHTEGDVWKHTILALQKINSPEFKKFEKELDKIINTTTVQHKNMNTNKNKLELILGVLFHDIGKPATIQTPEKDGTDRIRFSNHDNVGGKLTQKICQRLVLSSPPNLGISCDNISWLVKKHMILIHGHPSKLKSTTIEKYFFSDKYPGKNLIKLTYLDSLATITKTGPVSVDLILALLTRIKKMKKLVKEKKEKQNLPAPFLNGNEIMQILKIKPGKKIGEIKNKIREKQLVNKIKNKKQARQFVKKLG